MIYQNEKLKEISFPLGGIGTGSVGVATLVFRDEHFPCEVVLTAWNPMIPLDSENSSIPAAFFDITVRGGDENIKYTAVFSVKNPFEKTEYIICSNEKYSTVMLRYADMPEISPLV